MQRWLVLAISLATIHLSAEEPWGKDAALAQCTPRKEETRVKTPVFGGFAEVMIGFHQQVISKADGPRSHFVPSSSQYTLLAMRKYGFFQGFLMGCDRLMRENNQTWVYCRIYNDKGEWIKADPVR